MITLNLENVTGLGTLAAYTNDAVGGILFDGFMLVLFVVFLVIYNRSSENPDMESAFTLASYIMFFASGLFWIGEYIDGVIPLIFLLFSAIGSFYLYASKSKY